MIIKPIQRIVDGERVSFAELCEGFSRHVPLLKELEDTPQDPVWHAEGNVAIHTARVLEEMYDLLEGVSGEERLVLVLAALFHDIGKPLVTREAEINGETRITSPRHAEKGRSYLALRLPELGLESHVQDRILSLVGYHHHPRKFVLDGKSRGKFSQLARCVNFTDVVNLEIADLKGRDCPDLEAQLEILELFKMQADEYALEGLADKKWIETVREVFADRPDEFMLHAAKHGRSAFEAEVISTIEESVPLAYQLEESPTVLTILSGPAGSGKSTWIEQNCHGEAVISLDQLREKISGKRSSQKDNGRVLQAAKEALKECLRKRQSVIFDATNTRKDGRGWVAQLGYDYGAFVRIVCFRTSLGELYRRNRTRTHSIPLSALDKQIQGFEWPTLDEAHEVVVVDV
ncbi:hypothetical protein Rhal01_01796 [Rubritalea halochordaticola]|uniref:HD/PDEase domain-containing protein n=1 Tax=Rubritalea halochordaticola TaxID=714537 RepID=A0ABP9V2V3_9BACT